MGKIKLSAFMSRLGRAIGSPCIRSEDIERLRIYAASDFVSVRDMEVLVKLKTSLEVMRLWLREVGEML